MITLSSFAQEPFVKTIANTGYGAAIRIHPTNDNGWVIFTLDSMKLTKFNNCGVPLWSKQYNIANSQQGLWDFIKTSDDGFAFLTRMKVNSLHAPVETHAALVTKINSQGNIVWSKSYEDPTDDYTHYPYSMNEDLHGNLVIFCGTGYYLASNPAYNMILKINSNGVLLSTNFYDFGGIWGGATVTSDNGVLIRTGSFFIKTSNAGNVEWCSAFAPSGNYFAPVEVADGYIFTGYKISNNNTSFFKINKQGNLMWGGRKETSYTGMPNLHKKSNGNITAVYINGIAEFDKDLNPVNHSTFSGAGLYPKRICYLNDGTPVVTGFKGNQIFYAQTSPAYQTNCTSTPAITITAFNDVNQNNFTIGYHPYVLTEVPHTFQYNNFMVSVNEICNPVKQLNIGNDTLICKAGNLLLKNTTSDFYNYYEWSTGETTASITVDKPGNYWLRATYLSYGCLTQSITDTIVIDYATPIVTDLGADVFACEDESHVFRAPTCIDCSYMWSTGSTYDSIVVKVSGYYQLTVMDSIGCLYSDEAAFNIVNCECDLYIPNSFTPNDDGLNEAFQPKYYCDMADYHLKVFNRWGQPVFSTGHPTESWNGKQNNQRVPIGVYHYTLTFTPILKGKVDKPITKTGSVTILY